MRATSQSGYYDKEKEEKKEKTVRIEDRRTGSLAVTSNSQAKQIAMYLEALGLKPKQQTFFGPPSLGMGSHQVFEGIDPNNGVAFSPGATRANLTLN